MIERRERVLTDAALAGPQGRLLFAFLATRRNHAISKTRVIDAVWGTRTPPSAAAGNRAEALRVYSKCRKLFRDELGATPSPQTEAVFLQILRAAE
jgi:DNA-binding SARP family transcriptional activator